MKLFKSYIEELTVFISAKTPSLNASSKSKVNIESKEVITNSEIINIRTDKNHPNSLRTIERTLFNVNENIAIQDFTDLINV